MANGSWNRRTVGLAVILSLILLSGTFALFDSLESDGNNGDGENGEMSEDDAKNYLNRFGYIGETDAQAEQSVAAANDEQSDMVFSQQQQKHRTADQLMEDFSLDSLKSAIQRFQEFAGLPKTGELDNQTKKKMKQPRCGMQDVEMIRGRGAAGEEAYVPKWRKPRLTFTVDQYTSDLPQYMQKKALQMAFSAWSQHIPLDFTETTGQSADIHVRFARATHGDPWPFDGRGGVLAHATFPSNGQLHFDDDEQWAFMDASKIASSRYTDLFWVSLHEIGHILGISHSKVETAIMAPFYLDPEDLVDWRGNYKTPKLTSDDIRAAQQIYGARSSRAGGGTAGRRTGNGGGGHYDDNEGGFLSRLGKFLEGGSDNNEATDDDNADEEAEDQRGRHGHWGGGHGNDERRRHHTRKSQRSEDDGGEDEGGLLGGLFSINASVKMAPRSSLTALAMLTISSLFLLASFTFAI